MLLFFFSEMEELADLRTRNAALEDKKQQLVNSVKESLEVVSNLKSQHDSEYSRRVEAEKESALLKARLDATESKWNSEKYEELMLKVATVDVEAASGPDALATAWGDLVDGGVAPTTGIMRSLTRD